MTTLTITGTISDDQGNSVPFSASANQAAADVIAISSVAVTPDPAPPGTTRTLTLVATSSTGRPLTATISATGITFTPVIGQPPGTFAWTFVY